MSSAQATELCADFETYVTKGAISADLADYECKAFALIDAVQSKTDAAAQAACKAAYSQCAQTATTSTDKCTAPASTCTATVGELETCLSDTTKLVVALDASLPSCDTITVAQATAALGATAGNDAGTSDARPASCTTYAAKCPDSNMVPSM